MNVGKVSLILIAALCLLFVKQQRKKFAFFIPVQFLMKVLQMSNVMTQQTWVYLPTSLNDSYIHKRSKRYRGQTREHLMLQIVLLL